MIPVRRQGGMVILATLVIGLLLTVMPAPEWARPFRPAWHTLFLIYWAMALPHRVGVGGAWVLGILVDLLTGTLLGQHALSLSVIAFLVQRLHQRMRLFPLWQQAFAVLLLLSVERFVWFWVVGWSGQPFPDYRFWLAPLVGMVLWPWFFIIMRDIRRRFRVS